MHDSNVEDTKTMNADVERLKMLLAETIALLCQRGLTYERELRVQGLLGITVDGTVFLIPVDERTFSNSKPVSAYDSRETEISASPSNVNLTLQHHYSVDRQVAKSEVRRSKDDAIKSQLLPAPVVDANKSLPAPVPYPVLNNNLSSVPQSPQYPVVDNPGALPECKQEIVDIDDDDSNVENEFQIPGSVVSSQYFSTSEPASQFPSPQFPTGKNFSFGNSMSMSQAYNVCGEMGSEGKRKRKRSTFGDDMLVLDNDEWTNNSQKEANAPVAGCSYWSDFGDELNRNVAWEDPTKSANRRRHARDYDSKNFLCQYEDCNKAFFRKDHLVRHQRQKHGKPFGVDSQLIYYCYSSDCDKTFYKVASLNRHMIMAHNYSVTKPTDQLDQSLEAQPVEASMAQPLDYLSQPLEPADTNG